MLSGPIPKSFVLILVVLIGHAVLVAGQGANSLQGKVITPGGMQPTNSVRVRLTFNGRLIQETFTDLSGRFYFSGLSRGTYQLTAEGDGRTFETTSVYAELSGTSQLGTQDIQARPLPGKPLPQSGVIDAFVQSVPKQAREALERAERLIEQQKPEAAIEQLSEAVKIFPEYFEAHLQLGRIFLKAEQLDRAIAELDKAREINPNNERPYQSFGLVLMKQKNYPVAVAVFAEAARLNPNNPSNALMQGTALIYQASTVAETSADRNYLLSKAELALAQAARLSGDKVKPDSITLASLYEMKGEPERAAAELESYLRKSESKNPQLQSEITRLRAKAKETKPGPE